MNLKTAANQFDSIKTGIGIRASKIMKAVWNYLNYDLVENLLAPRRRIYVALDRDSISVVYGSRFLGKSRIHVCRKYAYERKSQETISRKYMYQDGQLPKPDMIVSTLDYFVNEFKAQNAKIILSIPKTWTIYRTASFPSAVDENIHDVVSYELDRLVSMSADNAYYDFRIVSKNQDSLKIAIAAARKDLIDGYTKPLEEKGLIVEKVTTNLSVGYGLLNHFYGRQCFVFLEAHPEEYDLACISDGSVLFAHKEKFSGEGKEDRIQTLSEELTALCEELKKEEQSIQVVVCGDVDDLEALRDGINVPVHIMQTTRLTLDYKGETREADFLSASGCLELLSANVSSINLLSQHKTIASQGFKFTMILAVAAILFGITSLVAPLVLEQVKIYEIERKMELLKEDFRKNEPQKNELDAILYQIQKTNEFKNSKPPRILLLRELSDIIPVSFWISRMSLSEDTLEIELNGKGAQGEVVSLLEASPYFADVRLENTRGSVAEKEKEMHANVFKMSIVNQSADREAKR